jgi:chaperonin cofactor prefoldin
MSLAQIKVTSSRDIKGREALLQLEIDSLRNQNRELQKQLHGLKLLMQEEAAEE